MLKTVVFLNLFLFAYGGRLNLPENLLNLIPEDARDDATLDTMGLLNKYGYPAEAHEVQTEDGYILTVHRITGGKSDVRADHPPVLLQHGLLGSSADWLLNGPEKSLGFLLADAGFDVWMGNARGNTYSNKHISTNPSKSKFWKFGWHEIGFYDLPAMVDYILEKTEKEKIHYIGHSTGSTAFFVLGSTKTEYNKKFKSVHALSPMAYIAKTRSPVYKLLSQNTMELVSNMIGPDKFTPNADFMALSTYMLCKDNSQMLPVCPNVLYLLAGFNPKQTDASRIPVYLSHVPTDTSSKLMLHYGQEIISDKFRQYDYGSTINMLNYGSLTPPKYNLHEVTAPVLLHYAEDDWFVHPTEVDRILSELGNPVGKFAVPDKSFSNLDFVWGSGAKELLYDRIITLLEAFEYACNFCN